jgi:flavin reductase (DIM6/NTAB) family NADH-FMN oxidoreductase RutF
MLSLKPKDISVAKLHGYLLGAVVPRPIALASTIDSTGNINLSPFSFFNVFSANPPIMIFSPARRVRDNTTKDTLENVKQIKEVVINIVNHDMVQQMSLSSSEYPHGVNEFEKAGFTQVASDEVTPPGVGESPVRFECVVNDVIALGKEGGAGNLVICEVVKLHVNPNILDQEGNIDPILLDAVARMGGAWYNRAKEGMFQIPKPLSRLGIGVNNLPKSVLESTILTGNDLGILGGLEALPTQEEITHFVNSQEKNQFLSKEEIHKQAQQLISTGNPTDALKLLIASDLQTK